MAKDPTSVAQRWHDGLSGARQKYIDGVNSVTVAPGAAAARQAGVWAQNTQAAQAKYARNVAGVTLQSWQGAAASKGADRLASGAAAAQPKMVMFMTKLLPYVASGRASLAPRGSYDQNKARMAAWVDYMHKFAK